MRSFKLHALLAVVFVLTALHATAALKLCGSYKRACGLRAFCDKKSKPTHCECDKKAAGCALVECHDPDDFQCVMKSDPHLSGFANPMANLNWPCKYRMTRVQHPLAGSAQDVGFCSFEVFGYNKVVDGKFFPSGVEINFSIGDFANQFFRQENVVKFDFTEEGVRTSTGTQGDWGSGTHNSWNGVEVKCSYDKVNRFAIFEVPRCDFAVKFRPYNESESMGPQTQVPSISILTGAKTLFRKTPLGAYPEGLCGVPTKANGGGDTSKLYTDRAKELKLLSPHLALLYDALDQTNVLQEPLIEGVTEKVMQDSKNCQAGIETFAQCSQENKVNAINICNSILVKNAKCGGIKILDAFNACIRAVCSNKVAGCARIDKVLGKLSCYVPPRKIRKLCRP